MRHLVILLSLLFLASCQSAPSIALRYTVSVPADVPERMDVREKGDGVWHRVSAHDLYRAAHREGWEECRQRFVAGEAIPPAPIDPASIPPLESFGVPNMAATEPAPARFRPKMPQELGLESDARIAGFCACHRELLKLIERHGEEAVRRALTQPAR